MSMQEYFEFLREEERQEERNGLWNGLLLKRLTERSEEDALAALWALNLKSGTVYELAGA